MIDFILHHERIQSNRGFTGTLQLHRERGNNGVYVVEFNIEGDSLIPQGYLSRIRNNYILYADLRKLKRRYYRVVDDSIHLEVDVKGHESIYFMVKKILSQ